MTFRAAPAPVVASICWLNGFMIGRPLIPLSKVPAGITTPVLLLKGWPFRKLEFEFFANIKSPNASSCLPQMSWVKEAYSSVLRTFWVLVGIFERSNEVTSARDAGAHAPFRFA